MAAGSPKAQPNRRIYIEVLRRMTPEQRLAKAFELSDMTREALRAGLAQRHPGATPQELTAMVIERLERCRRRVS
jgi:Xaa-Pro aminopeptidase